MKIALVTLLSILSLISFKLHAVETDLRLNLNSLYLSSDEVTDLLNQTGYTKEELLKKLVPVASKYARPGISNYHVGSAALGESGAIYLGVNLELQGVPLNQSVHSEQFAIANAKNHGEKKLVAIAISAAPCGHCRQFMNEMKDAHTLQILINDTPPQTLATLLPQSFGPSDLGLEGGLITPPEIHRAFTKDYSLNTLALIAAYNSYVPYSHCKSGVALQTKDGTIYAGSYLENAGFNPSLSPLQVALVSLVTDMRDYDEVVDALLIEQSNGKITQEDTTRAALKNLAPNARVRVRQVDMND